MMAQSRLSCLIALIRKSIERQSYKDRGAWIHLFVMTGAFEPDMPVVRIDNTACDGESQPGSAAFEFGLAG